MFILKTTLIGIVWAAGVSFIPLMLAAHWERRKGTSSWLSATALAAGYVAGHVAIAGWPAFPPPEAWSWLVYFAPAAALVGVMETRRARRVWQFLAWRAVLSGALLVVSLQPLVRHTWDYRESTAWLTGSGLAFVLFWTMTDRLTRSVSAREGAAALLLQTIAAALILALTGSVLLGQLAAVLTTTVAVLLTLSLRTPNAHLPPAGVAVIVVVVLGLWINGYFYSYAPAVCFVFWMTATILAWLAGLPFLVGRAHLAGAKTRFAAMLVPLLIAVLLALWENLPGRSSY